MTDGARTDEALVLDAVRRALVGAAGDLSFEAVLQQLVDAALDLVGARYAALGVPDGEGGFSQFITAGMSDELIESIGPLPRSHGLLDAMLTSPEPYRTPDVRDDPRFRGWWPETHPEMRSFLGYPIVFKGDVVGAFYLTDKVDAHTFSERDEKLVGEFVPHAAVLVEFARLHGQSRELSVADERNRIARELHDSLTQTLFGTRLALRTAITALNAEGTGSLDEAAVSSGAISGAVEQLDKAGTLLNIAFDELRALVWDLQPPDLQTDRLTGAVRKQMALLERTTDLKVDLEADDDPDELEPEAERQLLRIVQEAASNVVRHADASNLTVSMTAGTPGSNEPTGLLRVEIRDDGVGFDPDRPSIRSRRLGLTSMQERAAALGGRLSIDSSPGRGTVIRVEVPVD